MESWDELEKEGESDKYEEEFNRFLMALTSSDTESDSGSGSDCEEEVFSKLSRLDLISFIQDLMDRFQDKAIHIKILKRDYDLMKVELKFFWMIFV